MNVIGLIFISNKNRTAMNSLLKKKVLPSKKVQEVISIDFIDEKGYCYGVSYAKRKFNEQLIPFVYRFKSSNVSLIENDPFGRVKIEKGIKNLSIEESLTIIEKIKQSKRICNH